MANGNTHHAQSHGGMIKTDDEVLAGQHDDHSPYQLHPSPPCVEPNWSTNEGVFMTHQQISEKVRRDLPKAPPLLAHNRSAAKKPVLEPYFPTPPLTCLSILPGSILEYRKIVRMIGPRRFASYTLSHEFEKPSTRTPNPHKTSDVNDFV